MIHIRASTHTARRRNTHEFVAHRPRTDTTHLHTQSDTETLFSKQRANILRTTSMQEHAQSNPAQPDAYPVCILYGACLIVRTSKGRWGEATGRGAVPNSAQSPSSTCTTRGSTPGNSTASIPGGAQASTPWLASNVAWTPRCCHGDSQDRPRICFLCFRTPCRQL